MFKPEIVLTEINKNIMKHEYKHIRSKNKKKQNKSPRRIDWYIRSKTKTNNISI